MSFPKYARLENPPYSKREVQFKEGRVIPAIARRSELEGNSLASAASFESRVDQWSEASQRNAVDDEYDLTEMDEDHSPMFDDGLTGWREPRG
jgi:hypothetical protein